MEQKMDKGKVYLSPTHRWVENGHIFLWLLKDTCWVLVWKPGGIFMIFPTLSVALYILWRSKHIRAEFFHNLAVCLWISANSVWMVTEFLGVDKEYKKYAVFLFLTGIVILLVYYIFFFRKDREKEKQYAVSMNT
ncbi:MAG: hypothetical protein ACHQD8_01450 [Chitinophagales bacterium]